MYRIPSSQASSQNTGLATAFLNVWAPRADGSRVKVGAIPLKDTRSTDRSIIEALADLKKSDPELKAFAESLQFDFQLVSEAQAAPKAAFAFQAQK